MQDRTRYSGPKLDEVREYQGRSVTWLAERAGCDLSHLSKVLNGQLPLTHRIAERCCAALDIPLSLIVADERELAHAE